MFQKESSCCSSVGGVGGGDTGFGGWSREELDFGNGAFFAARVAFYVVGEETAGRDLIPHIPADVALPSGLAGPQSYLPLP